jgi:hypothetical protein
MSASPKQLKYARDLLGKKYLTPHQREQLIAWIETEDFRKVCKALDILVAAPNTEEEYNEREEIWEMANRTFKSKKK